MDSHHQALSAYETDSAPSISDGSKGMGNFPTKQAQVPNQVVSAPNQAHTPGPNDWWKISSDPNHPATAKGTNISGSQTPGTDHRGASGLPCLAGHPQMGAQPVCHTGCPSPNPLEIPADGINPVNKLGSPPSHQNPSQSSDDIRSGGSPPKHRPLGQFGTQDSGSRDNGSEEVAEDLRSTPTLSRLRTSSIHDNFSDMEIVDPSPTHHSHTKQGEAPNKRRPVSNRTGTPHPNLSLIHI